MSDDFNQLFVGSPKMKTAYSAALQQKHNFKIRWWSDKFGSKRADTNAHELIFAEMGINLNIGRFVDRFGFRAVPQMKTVVQQKCIAEVSRGQTIHQLLTFGHGAGANVHKESSGCPKFQIENLGHKCRPPLHPASYAHVLYDADGIIIEN